MANVARTKVIPAYRAALRELYKAVRILRDPILVPSHLVRILVNQPQVYTKSDVCFEHSRGSRVHQIW
jgi:hypothetical protein